MRRLLIAVAVLMAAVALAACGRSSAAHSSAPTPLGTALSYFPADTPVVATVSTQPRSASSAQLSGLPNATLAKAALFQQLARLGIDYNRDIKPLLGNPIALGIGSSELGSGHTAFLAAWQTRSAPALQRLVGAIHALSKAGTHDGATLYTLHGLAVAVAGTQLLLSRDTATIDAALDRHGSASGFTTAEYDRDLTGLPTGAAFSVVGDLATALDTPMAARARRVPWVAALRDYGVTFSGSAHRLAMRFRVDTSGRPLTAAQLPIAGGASAPPVPTGVPIAVGLRDPAQVYAFIKSSLRVAAPAQYRKLARQEAQARRRDGLDADGVARSLTGDLELASDGHHVIARVPVPASDMPALRRALRDPVKGRSIALGGGLYRITDPHGSPMVAGVLDGELVVGRATPSEIRRFATAPTSAVTGAQGALAVRVALGSLLAVSPRFQANPLLPRLTSMLGDLTASAQVTPQALSGSATLPIR